MASTGSILGLIGAMQTLIENFPMSLLDLFRGKKYTSVIDFVLDVLRILGVDDVTLTNYILSIIFDVPNATEVYNMINNYYYTKLRRPTKEQQNKAVKVEVVKEVAESIDPYYIYVEDGDGNKTYYVKHEPEAMYEMESEFITELEDSVKVIIANILTSVLSCSVNPEIPNYMLDIAPKGDKTTGGFISVPLTLLDTFNLLSISPTNEIGRNFYNVGNDLTTNTLYKTNDLNAFIWYVMNRGSKITQTETNKMMWDSRIFNAKNETELRDTPEKWNEWYNSKKTKDGVFFPSGTTESEALTWYSDRTTINQPLHPIMQLEKDSSWLSSDRRLRVYISSQTYFNKGAFNKTIYQFNKDYLQNIKIFSYNILLANMVEDLLNGTLIRDLIPEISLVRGTLDDKVDEIVRRVLEEDDTQVSDCYYSFSNEDFDNMLQEYEMQKYNATYLGSETAPAIKVDAQSILNSLNTVSSMATGNERVSAITKTVYEIASIPNNDESMRNSDKLMVGFNSEWIRNVIIALVRPLVRSILTPQVMLLFIINFEAMGMINLQDVMSSDTNKIMTLLYKKMLAIMVSIIKYIKDKLIEVLMNLFYEKIQPLLVQWNAIVLLEQVNDWITLLDEALKCMPSFDFSRGKVLGAIDDVTYADIIPEQNTPETTTGC